MCSNPFHVRVTAISVPSVDDTLWTVPGGSGVGINPTCLCSSMPGSVDVAFWIPHLSFPRPFSLEGEGGVVMGEEGLALVPTKDDLGSFPMQLEKPSCKQC